MDFNTDVAERVYDLVSKMDLDEAKVFTTMLADELYWRDQQNNARLIERNYARVSKAMTDELANDLLFRLEAGEDPEQLVAEAAAVAIAKDHDSWKFQMRSENGQWGRMTGAQYRAQKKLIRNRGKLEEADLKALNRYRKQQGIGGKIHDNEGVGRALQGEYYNQRLDQAGGVGAKVQTFQGHWNAAPNQESGTTDTFNRIAQAGNLASQIAPAGSKAQIAGRAAQLVGTYGPEAEKVVGPSLRKTAYRYRGTERTPDKKLEHLIEGEAAQVNRSEGSGKGTSLRVINGKQVRVPHKTHHEGLSEDQKVYAAEEAAKRYFLGAYREDGEPGKSRVPSAKRAELQRKSGRVTPSEGILIDRNGKVAVQAVGYAEDHYLPFNLKNLGALQGGSYVRTRESGGLTTEDIYTGLMSGARSMTVVSNSGVFTVDFADDLRGGRRFNDKARQMVSRYASTLDAVKSEQVANPDRKLTPEQRADIKLEVDDELKRQGLEDYTTKEEKEDLYKKAIEEHMAKPTVPKDVEEEIRRRADTEPDERSRRRAYTAMYDEALNNVTGRNYRLDGEGYGAAMDALQEQFPYYIDRVDYKAKTGRGAARGDLAERFNSSVDRGYVKPRFNRPEGAESGYYDESITGRGKGTADQTNYQNWRVRHAGKKAEAEGEETTEGKQVDAKLRDKKKAIDEANEKDRKNALMKTEVGIAADFWVGIHEGHKAQGKGGELSPSEFPVMYEYMRDKDSVKDDPAKVTKLAEETEKLRKDKAFLVDQKFQSNIPMNVANLLKSEEKWDDKKLQGETAPAKPMSLESAEAVKLRQNEAIANLLGMTDDQLIERSNKHRVERRKAANSQHPDKAAQHDKAVKATEQARAVLNTKVVLSDAEYKELEAKSPTPATTPITTQPETKRDEAARFATNRIKLDRANNLGVRMQQAQSNGDGFKARDLADQLADVIDQLEATDEEKGKLRVTWGLD